VLTADPGGFAAMWKEGFSGVAGRGSLWVLDGEAHRQERSLLTPSFHARLFRSFGNDIQEVTRHHSDAWRPGEEIRALETTLKISLDVIMRLVFGVKDGPTIVEGRQVVTDLWRKMHPITVFFPRLQAGWFPAWQRYQRARNNFTAFVMRRLAERRARDRHGEGDDLLGRMLAARYEDGRPMGDEEIRDELITILLAGHETTATGLSWALYELGRHPDIMERLRHELTELGPDPEPSLIVKLPYLGAVCDETLRLHTLLPEIARVLAAPMELFGVAYDANGSREVGIGVSVMAIHHDAEIYPQPDRFRPERFLERTYTPFEFLPFGGGHRRCLGAGLSDYEMRIALATIAMRWEVEPVGEEQEIRHDIAMGPKHGVRMRVEARGHASRRNDAGPVPALEDEADHAAARE
jgi:cytochrome P450